MAIAAGLTIYLGVTAGWTTAIVALISLSLANLVFGMLGVGLCPPEFMETYALIRFMAIVCVTYYIAT